MDAESLKISWTVYMDICVERVIIYRSCWDATGQARRFEITDDKWEEYATTHPFTALCISNYIGLPCNYYDRVITPNLVGIVFSPVRMQTRNFPEDMKGALISAWERGMRLQTVGFRYCYIYNICDMIVECNLVSSPDLHGISIVNCDGSTRGWNMVIESITSIQLRSVTMSGICMTDDTLVLLCERLRPSCRTLRELTLDDLTINDPGPICRLLEHCPNMEILSVQSSTPYDTTMIDDIVMRLLKLQRFYISFKYGTLELEHNTTWTTKKLFCHPSLKRVYRGCCKGACLHTYATLRIRASGLIEHILLARRACPTISIDIWGLVLETLMCKSDDVEEEEEEESDEE